jgi:hypothetical protein
MSSSNTPSTSSPLQLFPSPSSYLPPRKSSLKHCRSATSSPAPAHMRGVALQVTTANIEPTAPANNETSPAVSRPTIAPRVSSKRTFHARKRSSAPNLLDSPAVSEPLVHEDQLCPLPVNTDFTQSSPPRIRTPIARLKRAAIPKSISTPTFLRNDVTEIIDDEDQLSPLPTKLSFKLKQTAPAKQEYPSPVSFRSDGSTLVRSNSDATTGRSPSSATSTQPTRSMFPQYDHSKTLSQQHYFPRVTASPAPNQNTRTNHSERTDAWPQLNREDPTIVTSDGYDEIPKATASDLLTIWHASTTACPPTGQKVQLNLSQPADQKMSLALGSNGTTLYTMQTNSASVQSASEEPTTDLSIHKTCPSSTLPMPVSQLSLPANPTKITATTPPTTLFPHQAALDAIQIAANTPFAAAIAATDPTGSSPAAARLAQNAVAQAQRRHTCTIRRTTRNRTAGTAQYTLAHSSLGSLAITVSPAGHEHKAIIALHHPRATPAAIESQTLALLTLDFAAGVCVMDTPGLLALDELYILDVAVSAVLAVAMLENELCVREMVEFEPPPTQVMSIASAEGGRKADHGSGRKAKRLERKSREREAGKEKGLIRETVGLVGMGIKGVGWLMGAGLKAARASARPPPN